MTTPKDQSRMNLFNDPEQTSFADLIDDSAATGEGFPTATAATPKVVECLGQTFPDDTARRAYFTEKLREKLQDPAFRAIEGFPIGSDEDILALSDPPYYTACPNPFLEDFVREYGKPYSPETPYHREPFAADVSEGKNDPIYNAHSYHTKVPHKAIMRYILHYTEPGDLVFDGFCGTGMTGVAAQLCGDRGVVQSLGYQVLDDGTILNEQGEAFSKLGVRRAILNDLSPAATFIAYNYNTPVNVAEFEREANRILAEVERECGWMYETIHSDGKTKGRINYTVWSDVFICPQCTSEIIFWDAAVDKTAGKVRDEFPCPNCNLELTKRTMERAWTTSFDAAINQTVKQARQVPVLINYNVGSKRYEKKPDATDLELIDRIEQTPIPYWFPTERMPEGDEARRNDAYGITHIHQFFTKRNLRTLACLKQLCDSNSSIANFLFTSLLNRATQMNRIHIKNFAFGGGGANAGYLKGTLYVSSIPIETSVIEQIEDRFNAISRAFRGSRLKQSFVSTSTSSSEIIKIPNESVDYLFFDPPFGANIMYSELNFMWEAWLKVLTNNKPEAIENKVQGKGLDEYRELMTRCFEEAFRVLKPGRWLTVEFSNTQASVWNTIQVALQQAGFVVANVAALDKQQGSFKAVTTTTAVKQDLVISAYKANGGLEERFKLEAGTAEGAWDFVRTHLRQLPVFVSKNQQALPVVERMDFMLFDRMVAFHVQRGVLVPLSATEFYNGLEQRFFKRDEMYFLEDEVDEYDKKRTKVASVQQLELFVTGENSAIQWLRQQLTKKPQTFQEIQPFFLREIGSWQKWERPLELSELLEENFLRYEGQGPLPSQLISWLKLSSVHRDRLNTYQPSDFTADGDLLHPDASLVAAARERWYVANPNKQSDLEKKRDKALLREFETYQQSNANRLKTFRLEALKAGFKKAWQERNYQVILQLGRKIPDDILSSDEDLLRFWDFAQMRAED